MSGGGGNAGESAPPRALRPPGNAHLRPSRPGPGADTVLSSAVRSRNPGNRPLLNAYIACRGPRLTLHAGPALAPFADNFTGVDYVKEVQLPGGAIEIRGQDVVIENSFFVNLNYMGRAAIAFAGSRAAVVNSSFISCNNSAAGALYGNDSAIIKVLDSTFTNNGGGQGGAITVHNATLIVNGTTFLNNTSRGEGGAIAGTNVTVLQVMESTLMYNTAKVGAGGGERDCGWRVGRLGPTLPPFTERRRRVRRGLRAGHHLPERVHG